MNHGRFVENINSVRTSPKGTAQTTPSQSNSRKNLENYRVQILGKETKLIGFCKT